MINILHYYCKPNRRNLLNNITYQLGISCNVNDTFMDISDITKELTNKNHIHCIAIDEGLFGKFDTPESIKTKIEVLRYLCTDTEILIIALDKNLEDETLALLRQSSVADYVITQEMNADFDEVITRYLNGETKGRSSSDISKTDIRNIAPVENRDASAEMNEENNKQAAGKEGNDDSVDAITAEEQSRNVQHSKTMSYDMSDIEEQTKETLITDYVELNKDVTLTIGVCGLQPHIGTTHHALAMAKYLNSVYKNVCYKENNLHDAYRVLQRSSLAKVKHGHINMVGLDIFDRVGNISNADKKYKICVIDFGYMKECSGKEFFSTDIPIVIAGAKDWEIESFLGAYSSGVLDAANVIINFFPEHERDGFLQAFPETRIYFADYSPEIFEDGANSELYNKLVMRNLKGMEI